MLHVTYATRRRDPIDTLKIDQTFVRDLTSDVSDAAITAAMIAMAHTLELKVIAEGVETEMKALAGKVDVRCADPNWYEKNPHPPKIACEQNACSAALK